MVVFNNARNLLIASALAGLALAGCLDGIRSDSEDSSDADLESEMTDGKENDNELASQPSNITGTYLTGHFVGCEYIVKPSPEQPQGQLGCRLSRNEDGSKVPVASLDGQWEWVLSVDDAAAIEITKKVAAANSTWDVIYNLKLISDKPLAELEKGINVGIQNRDSSRSSKESLAEVQGRLTLLLAGNWQEIRDDNQKCFTNSIMRYTDMEGDTHILYFKNYFENTIFVQGERTDYFLDNPTCKGQPDFSSTVEQSFTVQRFDGKVYDIDYLLNKWLLTPFSKLGLEIIRQEYLCNSFDSGQLRLGRQSDIIRCWPEDIKIFYTSMKYQEPNRLFLAQSPDQDAGYSPKTRLREFKVDVRFEKISP
jgi:hypothetical protein